MKLMPESTRIPTFLKLSFYFLLRNTENDTHLIWDATLNLNIQYVLYYIIGTVSRNCSIFFIWSINTLRAPYEQAKQFCIFSLIFLSGDSIDK